MQRSFERSRVLALRLPWLSCACIFPAPLIRTPPAVETETDFGSMKRTKRTRLLARLLVAVPLLWVLSPWHILQHDSTAPHSLSDGSISALERSADLPPLGVDGGQARPGSVGQDGAPQCDSGPCSIAIARTVDAVEPLRTAISVAVVQETLGLRLPPPAKPPKAFLPIG
jgi:hypothetical protein